LEWKEEHQTLLHHPDCESAKKLPAYSPNPVVAQSWGAGGFFEPGPAPIRVLTTEKLTAIRTVYPFAPVAVSPTEVKFACTCGGSPHTALCDLAAGLADRVRDLEDENTKLKERLAWLEEKLAVGSCGTTGPKLPEA